MTLVRFVGGPYDGMSMDVARDVTQDSGLMAPNEMILPLLQDFQAAMRSVNVPSGGHAEVNVQSQGKVIYVRGADGVYDFVREEVLP